MGSPVSQSVPVANIFMAGLETETLESFPGKSSSKWFRHVDDIISMVKRSLMNKLLDQLNSRHQNIQFTVEEKQDGRPPVMDVLLNREDNGEFQTFP